MHPRSGGVGTPRGEGFELRTDAWGAVRAEKGLLITTYRTTGPHLEADPLASQLEASLELAKALSADPASTWVPAKLEANEALKHLKEAAQARQKQGEPGSAGLPGATPGPRQPRRHPQRHPRQPHPQRRASTST